MYAIAHLDIPPLASAGGTVRLPGSKSISNRALLLAALAQGQTRLEGLLHSDDTRVMMAALQQMGVHSTCLHVLDELQAAASQRLCLPSQGRSQSGSHSTGRGISRGSARTSWRAATLRSSSGRVIRSAMVFMASSERRSISSAWLLASTDKVCCLSSNVVLA